MASDGTPMMWMILNKKKNNDMQSTGTSPRVHVRSYYGMDTLLGSKIYKIRPSDLKVQCQNSKLEIGNLKPKS
ncbi:predicted protein [Sclerotinia sclerotiorum 1980 UF-70]|uniref:Uncharacterized protein n=1 Tax=Sclerotinia sclerotiorum (strain ATCC 18683 / 1980 / Ss-1) TaxID=665079 RepID=A7EDU1_SCLS1|nr:predicted protein [Sclerotinia sclerotiorum 1980 UF-70]EDO01007.1 predicted protein [Sclerotinia sclerotiorum 1980 UF-70]